ADVGTSGFPPVIRVVRNRDRNIAVPVTVVFEYDDAGIDTLNRLPNPIVVPINVQGQKVDLAGKPLRRDQSVDVLDVYPGLNDRWRAQSSFEACVIESPCRL